MAKNLAVVSSLKSTDCYADGWLKIRSIHQMDFSRLDRFYFRDGFCSQSLDGFCSQSLDRWIFVMDFSRLDRFYFRDRSYFRDGSLDCATVFAHFFGRNLPVTLPFFFRPLFGLFFVLFAIIWLIFWLIFRFICYYLAYFWLFCLFLVPLISLSLLSTP